MLKCKKCHLFDKEKFLCNVVVLHEGEKIKIPVRPNDNCFWLENKFENNKTYAEECVDMIRIWVEDENGVPSTKGKVKIQYPTK